MRKNDSACLARPVFSTKCLQPSWCQSWVRCLSALFTHIRCLKNTWLDIRNFHSLGWCASTAQILSGGLNPATVLPTACSLWDLLADMPSYQRLPSFQPDLAFQCRFPLVTEGPNEQAGNRISTMSDTRAGVMGVKQVSVADLRWSFQGDFNTPCAHRSKCFEVGSLFKSISAEKKNINCIQMRLH